MSTQNWKDRRAKIVERVGGEAAFAELVAEAAAEHDVGAKRLDEIRKAQKLTQVQLAEQIGVSQPAVSELETNAAKAGELYVSTLSRYLGAMEIDLELIGRYPDGSFVEIKLGDETAVA
jgi:DNA-binding XRE family transcriptional regulator